MLQNKIFIVLTSLLLLTAFNFGFADDFDSETDVLIGKRIPVFSLKSINNETINFDDFSGKPAVIFIFSTKCPYCIATAKIINKLSKANAEVNFFAICIDREVGSPEHGGKTGEQAARDFAKKYFEGNKQIQTLLADDTFKGDYADFFGFTNLNKAPINIFVDSDTRVVKAYIGSTTEENLENSLNKIK